MAEIQTVVADLEKSYLAKEAEITSAKEEEEVAATRRIRLERELTEILKKLVNSRTELYLAVIKQHEVANADLRATVKKQADLLAQHEAAKAEH